MGEKNLGTKLRPLLQLVPAVVVAAVILITLPHTGPVLAAVPERLSASAAASDETAASSEEEQEELTPALPYEDGVYTGSSRGYGGTVKVQVTMADGRITDLQIVSAKHETSNFLRRAKRLLNMVLDAQTWEVDAVSEATYTSRGILGAIQNALTGEVVINPAPPKQKEPEPLVVEEFTAPSAYRDGIYTASAEGYGGLITVQVTITNDAITDITIVDHAGESSSYFTRARYVIPAILESGTPEVDTISGATYSSTGILNAVKLALASAANEPEQAEDETLPAESVQPEETPESQPEEAPAQSEASAAEQEAWDPVADFFGQARDALQALFSGEQEPQQSAPSTVFRAPEPASSSVPEEAQPAEEPAAEPDASTTETEETAE